MLEIGERSGAVAALAPQVSAMRPGNVVARIDAERMLPERLGVVPHPRLAHGQRGEHGEDCRACGGRGAQGPVPRLDGRPDDQRPGETGKVAVAIGGDLHACLHEAEDREEDRRVAGPGDERPRPALPPEDNGRRESEDGERARDVARLGRVQPLLEEVERREPEG